jgi:predicted metal-dependent hydrolase
MTELTVRRLQVDLETPWPRHWNGGDAFSSAWFNALSFSFPAGEQFFIDAVKLGAARLEDADRARLGDEIAGFIGQEATHRRVHERFNLQLLRQGYVNHWEVRIRRRAQDLDGVDARIWLGATAATEHFTAILAEFMLTRPQALAGAEPRLRDLWLWHASEESEHRSTAFDLYRALGGNERWRRRLFIAVTLYFVSDLTRQTLHNLWRDGHWWRLSTWSGAWRLLFGRDGVVRHTRGPWRRYLAADFHPSEGDAAPGTRWLADHADLATPVQARQ